MGESGEEGAPSASSTYFLGSAASSDPVLPTLLPAPRAPQRPSPHPGTGNGTSPVVLVVLEDVILGGDERGRHSQVVDAVAGTVVSSLPFLVRHHDGGHDVLRERLGRINVVVSRGAKQAPGGSEGAPARVLGQHLVAPAREPIPAGTRGCEAGGGRHDGRKRREDGSRRAVMLSACVEHAVPHCRRRRQSSGGRLHRGPKHSTGTCGALPMSGRLPVPPPITEIGRAHV